VLTPQGIVEKVTLTSRFLKRKQAEYEALRTEIEGLTQELSATAHHASQLDGTRDTATVARTTGIEVQ